MGLCSLSSPGASSGGDNDTSGINALMVPEMLLILIIWNLMLTASLVGMCVLICCRRGTASKNKIGSGSYLSNRAASESSTAYINAGGSTNNAGNKSKYVQNGSSKTGNIHSDGLSTTSYA